MFEQVLAQPTQSLLERLGRTEAIRQFYLASGTGLALQLGHRISQDLDWFSEDEFDPTWLAGELAAIGPTQVTEQKSATLVAIVEGIEAGFYRYAFPLLFPAESYCDCAVASWKDILCMKLAAIGQSAAKRDYVDLFFGLQEGLSLRELLDSMKRKYSAKVTQASCLHQEGGKQTRCLRYELEYSEYHLVRSLAYFDEVEAEPMPTLLADVSWEQICAALHEEIRSLGSP